ncbi:MAG: HEAT repeat domain-containing protein, partial [Planctomycetaceae bacterium]|nr:HEAT repeat domain-containing protein [Planctomycetaceae bacterium]
RIGPLAEAAIPALEQIVTNQEEYENSGYAAEALGKIGVKAIPSLVRGLRSPRIEDGCRFALREMPEDAIPAVVEAIKSLKFVEKNSMGDWPLMNLLWVIGDQPEHGKQAIPVLIDLLSETQVQSGDLYFFSGPDVETARTLRTLRPPADPKLLEMLHSPITEVRVLAALSLEQVSRCPETFAAIPALTEGLDDEAESVRRSLACALGHLGPHAAAALPQLKARLELHKSDDGAWTRREIAFAIWQIEGTPELTVQTLLDQLNSDQLEIYKSDGQYRWESIEYLGEMGPVAKPALPRLLELAESGSLYAMHAIREIDRNTFEQEVMPIILRDLKRTDDSELSSRQRDLIRELPSFQPESQTAIPAIAQLLRTESDNDDFKWLYDNGEILRTLLEFESGAEQSVPQLFEFIQNKVSESRHSEAFELLGKLAPWKTFWLKLRLKWWGLLVPPVLVVLISLLAAAVTEFVARARSLSVADEVHVRNT